MRLIDAGVALDNLSGRLESMKDYDAVKDVINNMPTAYDVDKVAEKLKKEVKNIILVYDCMESLKKCLRMKQSKL